MNNGMAQLENDTSKLSTLLFDINKISYDCRDMDEQFACEDIESIKSIINKFINSSDKLSEEDLSDLVYYFQSLDKMELHNTSIVGQIKNKLLQNDIMIVEALHNAIYTRH